MTEKVTRDFKGVWIPRDIWTNTSLSITEKVFLVEIDSLDNEDHCHASNHYFADFFNLSKGRCSQIIKELEKKGLINISYLREGKEIKKRYIEVVRIINTPIEYINYPFNKLNDPIKNTKLPYLENDEVNNTVSINTYSNNTIIEKVEKEKAVRHKHGEFKNVLLTDKEFSELTDMWGIDKLNGLIEKLSLYIDSKGAKYKKFKSTLIGWEKREKNYNQKTNYSNVNYSNNESKWKGEQNFDF